MAAKSEDPLAPRHLHAPIPRPKRDRRLHWTHWVAIGLSFVLTITASFLTRMEINAKLDDRFERQSEQAVSLVVERMGKYESSLWGGVAAVEASGGDMTHPQWVDFSNALEIHGRYPGINGIGVIHHVEPEELNSYLEEQRADRPGYAIHPEHDEDFYLPISYIEPAETNAAAVGLDMAHEANRLGGVFRSRDTGTAQITGPIVLVQDSGQTPGFLFFAPWYDGDPSTPTERAATFSGVVYAPFVVSELMSGALDETTREIGIRIVDGDSILFDEHTPATPGFDPDPMLTKTILVPFYGRQWSFEVWTDQTFRDSAANNEPLIILLGGLLIDGLLIALFASMSRAKRKAHAIADDLTGALRVNAIRLEESNAELERFAYVASHDLKTPLRGIADLTEYIEEDLDVYLRSPEANPDVATNLVRLKKQTGRMDALIKGILDYSRIGGGDISEVHPFSFDAALGAIAIDAGLDPSQVELQGESGWLLPAGIYLEQVIQNLIVNAVTHRDGDIDAVHVKVTVGEVADRLAIKVADNGPGIDPRYHERIFDIFQRLDAQREGTGIGLAIVQRVVESHGGTITVASAPRQGAAFAFTWPGATSGPPTIDLEPHLELTSRPEGA